jgi:hypothetical protein
VQAFKVLNQQLISADLICNTCKTILLYFHQDTESLSTEVIDFLQQEGIIIENHHTDVLGAVIGATEEDVVNGLQKGDPLDNSSNFFRRLINPHLSVQSAMLLLMKCGVPKLKYLLRCIPPPCIAQHASRMDDNILNTAAKLLRLADEDMKQPEVIRQLQSPLASGGFGLTSAVQESPIAYLSSVVSCLSSPTLSQLLQEMSGSPHDASSTSEVSMLHRHLEQCSINTWSNASSLFDLFC